MLQNLIEKFSGEGDKVVANNIGNGEKIIVKLEGGTGQGLVITDRRIYIVKWGFWGGSSFGSRCNAFEFKNITGIEIKKALLTTTFEILTPAHHNTKTKISSAIESDNIIVFNNVKFNVFQEAVNIGRDLIGQAHNNNPTTNSSINLDDMEKLAELKDKGIITTEEFDAKKKAILGLAPSTTFYKPTSAPITDNCPPSFENPRKDKKKQTSPILVIFLIMLFIGWISILLSNPGSHSVVQVPQPGPITANATKSTIKNSDLQIIHESVASRFDGATTYHVLIAPVDLKDDKFKDSIKQLISRFVAEKGKKISLEIYDNKDVLEASYNKMSSPGTMDAKQKENRSLHFLAFFDGDMSTGIYSDTLSFFPGAFKDNKSVGKYIETIEYKP
jgi:hypothetical protein